MKKIVAIILTLLMVLSISAIPAFAEDCEYPEGAIKHTIVLDVPAGETVVDPNNNGISPLMWNQNSYDLGTGTVTYTAKFSPEHRNLAFETSATGAPSESYFTELMLTATTAITGTGNWANGNIAKVDWISVNTSLQYMFKITNSTSKTIKVTITFYTWP